MQIRQVKIKDLESINQIIFKNFSYDERPSKEKIKERIKFSSDFFYILEDDDKVISFIYGFLTKDEVMNDDFFNSNKHKNKGEYFYLSTLCTKKEYQSKGYGNALLSFIEIELRKRNVKQIFLITKKENICFYEKHKFVLEEKTIINKNGKIYYVMKKKLKGQ